MRRSPSHYLLGTFLEHRPASSRNERTRRRDRVSLLPAYRFRGACQKRVSSASLPLDNGADIVSWRNRLAYVRRDPARSTLLLLIPWNSRRLQLLLASKPGAALSNGRPVIHAMRGRF